MKNYLIQTPRLGLRDWLETDIGKMAAINNDPAVMEFFPGCPTFDQTKQIVSRMQKQFAEKRYCYFATDRLDNGAFIGFIGLSYQEYESYFTPCVNIGWRLKQSEWGKGFATEGAKACLQYGFDTIGLKEIYSVAPKVNTNSTKVMQKLGMEQQEDFEHPLLSIDSPLKTCVVYKRSMTPEFHVSEG